MVHEASLAASLLEMLLDIAEENNAKRVLSCTVRVGRLSGVVVDSFKFAFDVLKEEHHKTANTVMVIEEVPLTYRCRDCGLEFEREDFFFPQCPGCGSCELDLISGEEFDLYQVELEEEEDV